MENKKDLWKNIKKHTPDNLEDISEQFPHFCLKIFDDNLSNEQIENALIGLSANDESIDAFYIDDENKEINIFQFKSAKSPQNMKAIKKQDLSYLNDAPNKLQNNSYIDNHKNERVKDIAADYKEKSKEGYKTKLHFFHLGNIGDKNLMKSYSDMTYYDIEKIIDLYHEYDSKLDITEPPYINISLKEDSINTKIASKHTFVSIITGDELVKLREKHRYKLFDKNLRFSLGKNKINKGIISTALKSEGRENFYFYNSGLTITSKGFKYKQTNNSLRIEYPQIINGAQSVNAIYEAFKNLSDRYSRSLSNKKKGKEKALSDFEYIKVLFRVVQDKNKDGTHKISNFEKNVVKYNNTQNAIKDIDFYANNQEQIELQRAFANEGYFYQIKRGEKEYLKGSSKNEHTLLHKKRYDFVFFNEDIRMELLASIWMAYKLKRPSLSDISKANIFGAIQNKSYDRLFANDKLSEDSIEETIKEMIFAFNLYCAIESQTSIYGNRKTDGQIITKISEFKENDVKAFEAIKNILDRACFLPNILKNDLKNKLNNEKEQALKYVEKYQFISLGTYMILYVFSLIVNKCEYKNKIIQNNLYKNKDFIEKNIVHKWFKTIIEQIISKEYKIFKDKIRGSDKAFYTRQNIKDDIKNSFDELEYELDKSYMEIFPLGL